MALKRKEKEINGITYIVETMDGVRALKTQAKLIKILGAGITGLKTSDVKNLITKTGLNVSAVVDLLSPLMDRFDDDEVVSFILSLFSKGILCKGSAEGKTVEVPVIFETHFNGRVNDAWQVVVFILMTNFSMGE